MASPNLSQLAAKIKIYKTVTRDNCPAKIYPHALHYDMHFTASSCQTYKFAPITSTFTQFCFKTKVNRMRFVLSLHT